MFYFYQLFRLFFENNYHASQQHHRNHDSHCDASDVPLLVPIDEVQLERQEQIYCKNDRERYVIFKKKTNLVNQKSIVTYLQSGNFLTGGKEGSAGTAPAGVLAPLREGAA